MTAGLPAAGSFGRLPCLLATSSLTFVVSLAGCTRDDEVEVLQVPKDASPLASADAAKDDVSPLTVDPAERTDRMFAAIVPHGDQAWFFKLTGPDAAVAPRREEFLELLKSLRFDGDTPRWTLPQGWSERPGSAMRFATLIVPTEPPSELSVSSLGMPADGSEEYLLANINRWRGQMSLPDMTIDRLHKGGDADDETINLPLADGTQATLVSLKGKLSSGGMMPPFAGGSRPSTLGQEVPSRGERAAEPVASRVTYEVPEGWEELGAEGVSLASFDIGNGAAKVTVTRLTAGNELLPNVNRWRNQIGLAPIEESQLGEAVQPLTLGDGGKGDYVVLTSPDDVSSPKGILGVMAKRGETAWFVKLIGDAETALREKSRFEGFATSLRFPE